jgi:hypothetical protein
MTRLKKEIQQKCFALLKEFMDAVKVAEGDSELKEKKEEALDALELLKHMEEKSPDKKTDDLTIAGGICTIQGQVCPPSA